MTDCVKPARNIKPKTQSMLWGVAAGRCQFSGCNKALWRNEATNIEVNIAQKAHMWSFSDDGPRGNDGIDPSQINSIDNLMLVCHGCHTLIDNDKKGDVFSVDTLMAMKKSHEQRVELVTSIDECKQSQVVLFGANIGEHGTALNFNDAALAMMPDHYPSSKTPIELSLKNSQFSDDEESYWLIESQSLEKSFGSLVRPELQSGRCQHLSVFALAPQPLLIKFGSLLTDIPDVKLFQRHREPQTWEWKPSASPLNLDVIPPSDESKTVALNISLSASISNDRIYNVLGREVSIWSLAVAVPNRDLICTESHLKDLRERLGLLLDEIKKKHGNDCVLHVFPAMPVTAAIELGRVHMPKSDIRMQIYDQNWKTNGFVKTLNIS